MKPFITPELLTSGKKLFPFQCEGISPEELGRALDSQQLMGYRMPIGHFFKAAWEISFHFDSGLAVDFSSACTLAFDWQEVGSLNVRVSREHLGLGESAVPFEKWPMSALKLGAIDKLVFEDSDVVVECGIVFHGSDVDEEIVVAAGISPGSVSVKVPFEPENLFEPQFPLSMCRRVRI